MNYTNLNIKSGNKTFKYIVEYFDDESIQPHPLTCFDNEYGVFFFNDEQKNMLHEKNYWLPITKEETETEEYYIKYNQYVPLTYNISSFDLYFPRYSIETYKTNIYYVLTLNTWINGKSIYLGSYLIDRKNALAPSTGVRKFLNEEYYEYIRVNTVDPFYLIYGDEWKNFRTQVCGESVDETGAQKNNSASNINITLTPVQLVNGVWIKLDEYDSSQSVIALNNTNDSNYFSAKLDFINNDGNPVFDCQLVFNEVYQNNLEEYLYETYQITVDENFKIKYGFVIGDIENPYKYKEHVFENAQRDTQFILNEFAFDSWQEYIDGLYAQVFVIIQRYEQDILVLTSNKVFITEEVFKYLMNEPIRKVDLNTLDMQVNNYDVVNIIKNEIVSVERPTEYKSNIVKPIFVKVQETDSIRLHGNVTENIVINLDAYKNKVDAFVLKIGDINFYEIGRINSGVVFKVIGTNLPTIDGTYYILNNEGELVTTGKYTIVS